jgi:antitoxin YefM
MEMLALKAADIRNGFKRVSDLVNSGEIVLVSRPRNENLVILSEKEYNALEKASRGMESFSKLEGSFRQADEGLIIAKTMEELEDMEK